MSSSPVQKAKNNVQEVQNNINNGIKPERRTIFHELLDPELNTTSKLPTVDDLAGQAFSISVAASDTSGNAMTVATYYVIHNPEIYKSLTEELQLAFPDPNERFPYTKLEKLPYLTGVVKEAQR
jgi:cytochrome P450